MKGLQLRDSVSVSVSSQWHMHIIKCLCHMLSLKVKKNKRKKTSLSRQSLCLNEMVGGGGERKGGCQGFMVLHLCSRANTSLSIATDSCLHFLMQSNLDHCKNCQRREKHTKITQQAAMRETKRCGHKKGRETAKQKERDGREGGTR